jgi:5-methylcytosine-specific restriction endonuclease McrA
MDRVRKNTQGKRVCDACEVARVSERRRVMKRELVEAAGGACVLCGYDRCVRSLQFHHIDPATKTFTISRWSNLSPAKLREEVTKCVLLCANCHGEVEAGMRVCIPSL